MLYTYVPSLVKCTVFGVELNGLSKESFITIERADSPVTFRKAQDGSHTAFTNNDGSFRVTISLDQTSESNDFLHTIFKLHRKAGLNLKIPIMVTESKGLRNILFAGQETFFENEPTSSFSSETETREWVFICNNANYQVKGVAVSDFLTSSLRNTIRMIELSQAAGIDISNLEGLIDMAVDDIQTRLERLF